MMNRLQLMKVHALLAAFIFPVVLMFIITGAFYTWGIKGTYTNTVYDIQVSEVLQPNLNELAKLAETELSKRNLDKPSGEPKLKSAGLSFMLEWSGSSQDLILEPTDDELLAKLTIKDATLYRNFVQLHKAKGGVLFKIYAAILSISLGLLLLSGFVMAWQIPALKRMTIMTFIMGVGSFIVIALLS